MTNINNIANGAKISLVTTSPVTFFDVTNVIKLGIVSADIANQSVDIHAQHNDAYGTLAIEANGSPKVADSPYAYDYLLFKRNGVVSAVGLPFFDNDSVTLVQGGTFSLVVESSVDSEQDQTALINVLEDNGYVVKSVQKQA